MPNVTKDIFQYNAARECHVWRPQPYSEVCGLDSRSRTQIIQTHVSQTDPQSIWESNTKNQENLLSNFEKKKNHLHIR